MPHIRVMVVGARDGEQESTSMTSITVRFEGFEATDFHAAKAKALGYITQELCRYGLHEALNGIGILDDYQKTNGLLDSLATIAGERGASDNLMGNADIAREALKRFRG